MLTPIDFLQDLTNPALGFLPRALFISIIVAAVCGVVGTHVVLRGMAFIGDAVAHAVFPGLAIAFAMQASILLGGAVAGAAVAILIAVFSQRRRVKEDTVIGIFFAASFAIGLVIIARVDGYTGSLTSVLFGSITGVSERDIIVATIVGAVVTLVILALTPQLTAVALDRETARAMNLPVVLLDIVLYLAVTAAVVISIRTIGNILVLALLLTPAATARLVTNKLTAMMALSAAIGVTGSIVGLYLSWAADMPTGATIVLTLTAGFLVTWALSPFNFRRKVSA
ncbi:MULTISPECIES: anchored repeat-type ABC transporter permease subunit [unclassified Corynebacterium]|uniref:anchored repeat-type ABC transporter permease subunit n=1 Tax=unclassified Corynebacterium TaxID=2624378 RepID=UPI002A912058|nr:anchored repeat-type ABC transporter permease subunit [Corynebacterium sp.]MDY5786231.1 anchored repeat-type ABC transporter permease subunit [Corynebacterium sp.]